jgi:adenosylcobinamide amidohydrolase
VNLVWHVRGEGDLELPAFSWRPDAPVRVASTSVLGGGIGERSWFLNASVPASYEADDPAADLRALATGLGLGGDGVGMLTAKDVRRAVVEEDDGVEVVATVGLGWPTWAAAPPDAAARVAGVGTVNVLAVVPAALGDAALVNAVATATEAKVQALLEAGVPGTGTASDAVCVAAAGQGAPEAYGGPRSRWGSSLARAVHRAVLRGAR